MKKLILLFLYILLFYSCSDSKTKYEYIVKDESFIQNFKLRPNSKFIELSKGFTYYKWENKKINVSPIVLVHGFSVPSYIWRPTFEILAKKGHFVISLDLYGRGFSENVDGHYTDELFANQVIDLIEKLNINNVKLVGLSNGGRVISKIANLRPELVEKLIYVASSAFKSTKPQSYNSVSQIEVDNFIKKQYPIISKGQLEDFKYPEKHIGWEKKYEELLKYKGFARALISTRKNHYSMDNIHAQIQQSDIPVYTLWGDSDKVVIYTDFEKRIDSILPKRIEFFISDSGHLPHMENPKDFNKILLSII